MPCCLFIDFLACGWLGAISPARARQEWSHTAEKSPAVHSAEGRPPAPWRAEQGTPALASASALLRCTSNTSRRASQR